MRFPLSLSIEDLPGKGHSQILAAGSADRKLFPAAQAEGISDPVHMSEIYKITIMYADKAPGQFCFNIRKPGVEGFLLCTGNSSYLFPVTFKVEDLLKGDPQDLAFLFYIIILIFQPAGFFMASFRTSRILSSR